MYETWLRSFHAVARHRGFTAAAKALNLSQPTITEQVKALEGKFGVELFHRRGRTIRLTDDGQSLYEITQGMAGHVEEAIRHLEAATSTPGGRFAIGSVTPYYVMSPIKAFRDRHPGVDTPLTVGHRREIIQGLLDFRLDVALIGRHEPDPRIDNVNLGDGEIRVLLPADHPLSKRRRLKMKDLDGMDMVVREPQSTTRQAFERAVRKARIRVATTMEMDSREAIREAVALGIGFGLVTADETLPTDRVCSRPVVDAEMKVTFNVACLKGRRDRPLIADFVNMTAAQA